MDLMDLIRAIHNIDGLERIRLGSLEPTYIDRRFIDVFMSLPKLCPHFHISLQSGSDSTLKRMGRRYTAYEYGEIVETLRRADQDVAITTDVMVGFPGETDREFDETYKFVKKMAFSKIHVFKYSPREGTPAARFKNQVPSKVKQERSDMLITLGDKMEQQFMNRFLGKEERVLFEQRVSMDGDMYEGYTDNYIKVMARSDIDIQNKLLPVILDKVGDGVLFGSIKGNSKKEGF